MQYYQHEFDDVQHYLHHRPPYLMVDRIISVEQDEIITEKSFTGEEFFVAGHFPGAPILPGAMMQEMSTQTAGILIAAKYNPMERFNTQDPHFNEFALGVLVGVQHGKFKGFARPGDTLRATVKLTEHIDKLFDFSATIEVGNKTIMRNSFRLTNIASESLMGAKS